MRIINLLRLSLTLLPLFLSCSDGKTAAGRAVNKVEKQHIDKQFKRHGFQCTCLGGGGDGKRFTHLSIAFDTREALTIDSARKYLVEGVLEFISDINSSEDVKEHFAEWPFTAKKLEYGIHTIVGNGIWPRFPDGITPDKKISYARFYGGYHEGEIDYYIKVEEKKLPETIHTETLEEAIAVLKAAGWSEPKE